MNIWEIEQELYSLFEEFEENGGELTPELEQELKITQENFKQKIKDYTCVIKDLEYNIAEIKAEKDRLSILADKKTKTINKLKDILLDAINQFGDTKKTGVKFIDFGTGQISIRKSKAVEVNTDYIKDIVNNISGILVFNKNCNQLDTVSNIDCDSITKQNEDNLEELSNITLTFKTSLPISDLINGKAYSAVKEIVKYSDTFGIDGNVSKTDMKAKLEQNGSCAPNLAKIVINENLTIK